MKLPNYAKAFIDIKKLQNYALNPNHKKGKHKARVFASALNLTIDDAEKLRDLLLEVVKTEDALLTRQDIYGCYYLIDSLIIRDQQQALVRSTWIIRQNENFPRLTSCYVI